MKNKTITAIYIAIISVCLVNLICLYKPFWLPFERRVYDTKYRWNVSYGRIEDIVVVDIDEKSLQKLGRFQNWPRAYFAEVISYLDNADVVGLDVFFAEPDTLPIQAREYFSKPSFDSLMEYAIQKHGRIVLVSDLKDEPIFTRFNRTGYGYIFADEDGVVRKGFHTLFGHKTFAAEIAEMVKPEIIQDRFLIYFLSGESFRKVSFSDIYLKRVPKDYFRDKIVLIGGTAPGLFDYHSVPFKRHFPGLLIQANLVNNFINVLKVDEISYFYVILLTFTLSAGFALLALTRSGRFYVFIPSSIYVLFVISSFILFNFGIELGIIRPTYTFVLVMLFALTYRYKYEEREKGRIKTIFARYYSKELVDKVTANPPKLGGERTECTVVFADIRDFTAYAEKTSPERVGQRLNMFLDEMVQTIFAYQGRVDKFIGDCVMAVFGSPVYLENHALVACLAAVEMVQKAEKQGFEIGIGINSGEVISGNFGSLMRMEYTVIGDAVNLASRLEGVAKRFNCSIVVGPDTYAEVVKDKHAGLQFKKLGMVKVKGKEEELLVYALTPSAF